MVQFHTFYSKKTFENLNKFVFTSYPTQPRRMHIESIYSLVATNDGKRELTQYHIIEILKENRVKIRILKDERSIGFWEPIETMRLEGMDYKTLCLGTKENIFRFDRSDFMDNSSQMIKLSDFPEIAD